MGLAQELQQIAQLQLLNENVDDLETANANIYLDSGDINVAQTTLEMLIGGQASVLNTESPHYKTNYIWGTNELLTSIKTSLGTIDDTIDTTPGQEKLKVDIVSATASLDVNTDDLESKVLDITGSNPDFSNLFENGKIKFNHNFYRVDDAVSHLIERYHTEIFLKTIIEFIDQ